MKPFMAALCLLVPLAAQRKLLPEQMYERVVAVVPMIGAGTFEDPRRPMFAPNPHPSAAKTSAPAITAFAYELSDDGKSAIVEFVARDPGALKEILESRLSEVKVFRKEKDAKEDIEREAVKVKRGFKLEQLRVGAQ